MLEGSFGASVVATRIFIPLNQNGRPNIEPKFS